MNSYKIKSIDRIAAVVEYIVNGKIFTEKYDARYLPVDDAKGLDIYFQTQLASYASETTIKTLPAEVVALVNVKKDYDASKLEVVKEAEVIAVK